MSILKINSSIRNDESVSRALVEELCNKLKSNNNEKILERDLVKENYFINDESFSLALTKRKNRTNMQLQNNIVNFSDLLIKELKSANTIVIGVPIYNFSVPASLKAWADLVARAGETFKYTENGPKGLLEGKKAYIIAVSGGVPVGSNIDFMSPWLKFFLSFIGIYDVTLITADGLNQPDRETKIKLAYKQIEDLKV